MKKWIMTACLAAGLSPALSQADNLEQTCTAYRMLDHYRLEAFCIQDPEAIRWDRARENPIFAPIRLFRRTSIHLDQCVGVDSAGNLSFGASGRLINHCGQHDDIHFNHTKDGPMLYGDCIDDEGNEVVSVLNLHDGLSSVDGQLVCGNGE